MKKYDLNQLLADITAQDIAHVFTANGCGQYSLGIVNSSSNGKRITISKTLAKDLGLEDYVEFAVNANAGVVLAGKKLPVKALATCELRGQDKKICYFSEFIVHLTKVFQLNFTKHTSMSFSDIKIEPNNGNPFAVIAIENKHPVAVETEEIA